MGLVVHRCCKDGNWFVLLSSNLYRSYQLTRPIIGILTIFAWRIVAKFLLHRVLPPTFRLLGQLMTLPHRRFYTPATDYQGVPAGKGLHPFPSVLDLPGMLELEADGMSTGRATGNSNKRELKLRAGRGGKAEKATPPGREGLGLGLEELGGKDVEVVKHYDADGEHLYSFLTPIESSAALQCSQKCSYTAGLPSWHVVSCRSCSRWLGGGSEAIARL